MSWELQEMEINAEREMNALRKEYEGRIGALKAKEVHLSGKLEKAERERDAYANTGGVLLEVLSGLVDVSTDWLSATEEECGHNPEWKELAGRVADAVDLLKIAKATPTPEAP